MKGKWLHAARGLLAALLLAAGCAVPTASAPPPARAEKASSSAGFVDARLLIIVRHGDIDVASKQALGGQVPLTPRGEERALDLDVALRDAGITRIVTSQALRTRMTAAALARRLGIQTEDPFGHGAEAWLGRQLAGAQEREAAAVVEYLAKTSKPGDVVLLVHHHSVIPSILAELGYPGEPAIDDTGEFDRLYVVIPDSGPKTYRVLRLRYGGPATEAVRGAERHADH